MIRDAKLEDIKSIMCLVSDFFIDSINEYGICMTEDTIEETLDNLIKHHIFLVNIKDTHLEIKPINLDEIGKSQEYTVFDAIRDNKGKGIKAKDLLKVLEKTV